MQNVVGLSGPGEGPATYSPLAGEVDDEEVHVFYSFTPCDGCYVWMRLFAAMALQPLVRTVRPLQYGGPHNHESYTGIHPQWR